MTHPCPSRSGDPLLPQAPPQPEGLIVACYLAGITAKELGERFGIHRTTVSGILEAQGVAMRQHPMQPAKIGQAIRLYESGLSKIAEKLPYKTSTIWRTLRHEGVTMRACHG